jgi:hypothetical protein
MTRHVSVELPEDARQALRLRSDQPPQELQEAAVLRWFEEGRLFAGSSGVAFGAQPWGVFQPAQGAPSFSCADDR